MGQILKSLSPAYGGFTIARDDRVIFIKGAIPGEVVDVEITDKKRDYSVARTINVLEPSEDRVDPPCPVFGICGGCQLQYVSYGRQLAMKDEVLLDSLARLGGIETALGPVLSGDQWHYRHRAQFKVSKTGEVGFFRESSRDVVTFEQCPLLREEINGCLRLIREKIDVAGLSDIHVALGDRPLLLLKGKQAGYLTDPWLSAGFPAVAYNESLVSVAAHTTLDLNGMTYMVSPWTFFQAHWDLNRQVVGHVAELLPLEGKVVLDLYAGAGNFSLPIARRAAEVTAVEEHSRAVEDGVRNAKANGIKNCKFVQSSAEKFKIQKKYDVVILDPPRPGLASEVAKRVLDTAPGAVIYISCNPATLARDIKKLKAKYDLKSVSQIDFFPNTYHIEAVALLLLR